MVANKHYFYVLLTNDQTYYGGYTIDPIRRIHEHNEGIGAKYTRIAKRRPVQMIHLEEFSTRSQATSAEAAFKKLTSRNQKKHYLLTKQKSSKNLLKIIFKK
jgi:putative endonuclease